MALAFAIFMFSLAGIPPLAGFFGKLYVFKAAIDAGLTSLALIGVIASVVGAYYYLRIVKLMYFDEPAEAFDPAPHVAPATVAGLAALAWCCSSSCRWPLLVAAQAAADGSGQVSGRAGRPGFRRDASTLPAEHQRPRCGLRRRGRARGPDRHRRAADGRPRPPGPRLALAARQPLRLPAAAPRRPAGRGRHALAGRRAQRRRRRLGLLERPHPPRLKWPNDVLLDGAKLAGILLEGADDGAGGCAWVIVGMGVNLGRRPRRPALRRHQPRRATGRELTPDAFLDALAGPPAPPARRLERWRLRRAAPGLARPRPPARVRGQPAARRRADQRPVRRPARRRLDRPGAGARPARALHRRRAVLPGERRPGIGRPGGPYHRASGDARSDGAGLMLLAIDVGNTNTVFALYRERSCSASGGCRPIASAPPRSTRRPSFSSCILKGLAHEEVEAVHHLERGAAGGDRRCAG